MPTPRICFVVMPFRPELNYFYLYIKMHLEQRHKGLIVERGDSAILTKPLMEKIRAKIETANLIIGDITGSNPNVFYELGLAHANNKAVIFLTQDPPEKAPVDLRHFEFIQYDLGNHDSFLSRLDNAVQNTFARDYAPMFEEACGLLTNFNASTNSTYSAASAEEFQIRVMRGEYAEGIPGLHQESLRAGFLLPRIIADATDIAVMRKITEWVTTTWGR
jgi:hypothetical protein